MKRPVCVRVKVEDELRCRFKGAAWRAHQTPSQVLRQFMERFVEMERDRYAFDLTVWSNSVERASHAVRRELPVQPPVYVYEDDDEVTVARKEGWASPGFGRP